MKNAAFILAFFSISLFANDPCEGLTVYPGIPVETDPQHPCQPRVDGEKNRMVVRKPGYRGLHTLEEVATHETIDRKWCGLGGHYYVNATGHISKGRPEAMQGANEINGNDGNKNKLGIQTLLPEGLTELPEPFIGNFTKLILCQMYRHQIAAKSVKTHVDYKFHPGPLVQDLLDKILAKKEEL